MFLPISGDASSGIDESLLEKSIGATLDDVRQGVSTVSHWEITEDDRTHVVIHSTRGFGVWALWVGGQYQAYPITAGYLGDISECYRLTFGPDDKLRDYEIRKLPDIDEATSSPTLPPDCRLVFWSAEQLEFLRETQKRLAQ